MSLRKMLGADAERVHEQVDALLDSEDAVIVLVDRSRATSYGHGFGISPSQLELLMLDIERSVRNIAGPATNKRRNTRTDRKEREQGDESGRGSGVHRPLERFGRRCNGPVVDRRRVSVSTRGAADHDNGIAAPRVLRLAREAVATDG
jgi:hypothetical protein